MILTGIWQIRQDLYSVPTEPGVVVPWDQVKKHMHVQTPLINGGPPVWIFRTGKNGRTKAPEPESRRDGQVPGQAEAGAAQQALAEEPEGCRHRIMKIKNWRRYLSVPTGNRSAAIRRETPWVRERPKPGVQAARATGLAVGRGQTDQAGRRMWDGPGHRE